MPSNSGVPGRAVHILTRKTRTTGKMIPWGPPRDGLALREHGGDEIVAQRVQRWTEVTPSQFTHEAEGLGIIRALLPPNVPFRAWSNFEFRDGHGKWHEVDLLVLGRRRLHLVELKYYSGTLRGDDLTWRRDGHRAEDSPLKLARRKAQRLASKLQDELPARAREKAPGYPTSAQPCRTYRSACSCTIPTCSATCPRARPSTCSAWMSGSARLACPASRHDCLSCCRRRAD